MSIVADEIYETILECGIARSPATDLYVEQALEVFVGRNFDIEAFMQELLSESNWTPEAERRIRLAIQPYEGEQVVSQKGFSSFEKEEQPDALYSDEKTQDIPTQNNTLKVLVVEPLKAPYVKEIDRGLESLQHEVGGYIEAVYPFEDPVGLICNEEGKLDGLPLNRSLRDDEGDIYDVVSGNFLIVGLGEEDFDSLSNELIDKFMEHFKTPESFIRMGGRIVSIPLIPEKPKESLSDQIASASGRASKSLHDNEAKGYESKPER